MPRSPAATILIIAGIVLIVAGLLVATGALSPRPGLSWFGRLPGDLRIERPGVRVYVPITSMLLASAALSIIATIVRAFR